MTQENVTHWCCICTKYDIDQYIIYLKNNYFRSPVYRTLWLQCLIMNYCESQTQNHKRFSFNLFLLIFFAPSLSLSISPSLNLHFICMIDLSCFANKKKLSSDFFLKLTFKITFIIFFVRKPP